MIILDTNVASELGKTNPDLNVLAWFARQPLSDVYLTAVSEAELGYGVANMPNGRRRNAVAAGNDRVINGILEGRVLPFDRDAAQHYAEIRAHRERIGRPISEMDGMIAAIARVNGAAVATRDAGGFADCGIQAINPWEN